MTKRENLISLYRRKGYDKVPIGFELCPSLCAVFKQKTGHEDYEEYFNFSERTVGNLEIQQEDKSNFKRFYNFELAPHTVIDAWGVAHEPGSAAAKHMTRMRHPLANIESVEQLKEYPFPDFKKSSAEKARKAAEEIHNKNLAAVASVECTIWETSWYMRSMEQLMVDMLEENEIAEYIFDKVTENACIRVKKFAHAGVDIIRLGDDIGMQRSIMMSETLYRTWIKPRLKKVIESAKAVNNELIIQYHSCGYVTPFINDLIETGIDVLNPVQPECMNFKDIHEQFGDRLSFNGTIGTQTTMPFGSPKEVRREVFKNLEIAGNKGGLFCTPTHLLEPEVPWENIVAYVEACRDFIK